MQLKQRIRKLEKTSLDDSQMTDKQLAEIAERDRENYPNRYKRLDEIQKSLSDFEAEAISKGTLSLISLDTLLGFYEAYQIPD